MYDILRLNSEQTCCVRPSVISFIPSSLGIPWVLQNLSPPSKDLLSEKKYKFKQPALPIKIIRQKRLAKSNV